MQQDQPSLSYSASSSRLDEIVRTLHSSDVDIDSAVQLCKEGRGLVRCMEESLRRAERMLNEEEDREGENDKK